MHFFIFYIGVRAGVIHLVEGLGITPSLPKYSPVLSLLCSNILGYPDEVSVVPL